MISSTTSKSLKLIHFDNFDRHLIGKSDDERFREYIRRKHSKYSKDGEEIQIYKTNMYLKRKNLIFQNDPTKKIFTNYKKNFSYRRNQCATIVVSD